MWFCFQFHCRKTYCLCNLFFGIASTQSSRRSALPLKITSKSILYVLKNNFTRTVFQEDYSNQHVSNIHKTHLNCQVPTGTVPSGLPTLQRQTMLELAKMFNANAFIHLCSLSIAALILHNSHEYINNIRLYIL